MLQAKNDFSLPKNKLLSTVFPIKSSELIKFIPMSLLMFCILLNQNIVRGIKDNLIISKIGAESISFIKLWFEMPAGVLFVIIYTKLCNTFTTEKVFRIIVTFFLIFFWLFAFVIFPNREVLHVENVDLYIQMYPHFKWFIIILSKWSFIIFYVIGELWPIIVFTILFWQLANKITTTKEAARFYTLFCLFGQCGLLVSGSVLMYFASETHFLYTFFDTSNHDSVSLKSLMCVVIFLGILCLIIHRFIEKQVIAGDIKNKSKNVLKLTIKESAKIIIRSKYLMKICLIIISYSISVNLLEGTWMYKAYSLYPTSKQFLVYQGRVLFWTGISTLIFSFLGNSIIKYFGWLRTAMITPVVILLVGGTFFLSIIFADQLSYILGMKVLLFIVFMGTLQNVLGKGSKYSLFDTTKEMLYIPLDEEMKTKGKAAVDVLGLKIGKALGALLQNIAFIMIPLATYDDIVVSVTISFVIVLLVWIYSLSSLSDQYNAQNNESLS